MRIQFFILAACVAFSAYADNLDSYGRMYAKAGIARDLVEVDIAAVTSEAVVGKSYELLTITLSDRSAYQQIGRVCAYKVGGTRAFTDVAGKTRVAPNAVCPA